MSSLKVKWHRVPHFDLYIPLALNVKHMMWQWTGLGLGLFFIIVLSIRECLFALTFFKVRA